jgi:hypothetical protein
MAINTALAALKVKFEKPPLKKKVLDISLNGGHLLLHLFYNHFEETFPRNVKADKLPSADAEALGKMNNPIASRIVTYRSNAKTLGSLRNATTHISPATTFGVNEAQPRARLLFNVISFDNVERIFSQAEQSVPINMDKRGRRAFIVPSATVPTEEVLSNPLNAAIFEGVK